MVAKKKSGIEQLDLYTEEENILGVSEYLDTLNDFISEKKTTIRGEISRVTERGRAVYFTLLDKDDRSALNCLIWTSVLSSQGITLRDGMEVTVNGYPNIYKPTGRLSFMARRIGLVGEGALKAAFEKLKKRLEEEGYFEPARKRPIPPYIHSIGLITADGREAQKDFLTFLGAYGYRIRFIDVRVEGINALDSIVGAIRWFNENTRDVEALVVTRGGGGLESLQAFNSEEIARAIYSSRIPVISAVGHENDVTICDMVADFRASTPTHAGQYLSQPWRDAEDKIMSIETSMASAIRHKITGLRESLSFFENSFTAGFEARLSSAGKRLAYQSNLLSRSFRELIGRMRQAEYRFAANLSSIARALDRRRQELSERLRVMDSESARWILSLGRRLDEAEARLNQNDPSLKLKQGYSIVKDKKGAIIKSARQVAPGDIISVRTYEGGLDSKVEKTY